MSSFVVRYLPARLLSDDLTLIECPLAGSKMRLQDISSINGKRRKWRIQEFSTERGEATKRDYDLATDIPSTRS